MAIKNLSYSFLKGLQKVTKEDYPIIQNQLYNFLGCSSQPEYYRKRKSYVNIPAHIKEGVEAIFLKYGINPEEVWEITNK